MSLVFQPVSFKAGQVNSFPEQEIQSFCALHRSLSTGSQTPGWVMLVVRSGETPAFATHLQLGSPAEL